MSDSTTCNRASIRPGNTLRTLGALEEYFWLLGQRVARATVVAAEIDGATTVDRWRDALRAVQAHHTILSARIQQRDGYRPSFEFMPDVPLALGVVPRESGTRLFELVSSELSTRFAPGDALLRATILHGRDSTTLLLAADHAAFDGMSLMFLIRDLLRALTGESLGSAQTMPPSYEHWLGLATSDRYASVPSAQVAQVAQSAQAATADAHLTAGLHFAPADDAPLLQQVWLEPSITSLVTRRARAEQTTVHGALCAAVMLAGRALSRSWRDSTIRCASTLDSRALLDAGERLGLLGAQRFSELDPSSAASFWDLARAVKQDVAARRTAADAAGRLSAPILEMISARSDPDRLLMGNRQRAPMLAIDNYGRLPIATHYGRLRLKWVTPAAMSGAPHTQTLSVATVEGLLCMTNVSAEPMPSLLGTSRRLLLAQLD